MTISVVALEREGKRASNGRARASVLVGLVGAAAVPAAVAAAEVWHWMPLIDAAAAIPVAFVLGVAALVLAQRARRRVSVTIGRVGGARLALAGKALGLLAIALASAGVIAVGFDELLTRLGD
jgi:hypothetical protein